MAADPLSSRPPVTRDRAGAAIASVQAESLDLPVMSGTEKVHLFIKRADESVFSELRPLVMGWEIGQKSGLPRILQTY